MDGLKVKVVDTSWKGSNLHWLLPLAS